MTSHFSINKNIYIRFILIMFMCSVFSQVDTNRITAQFALGVNSPSSNGFVEDYKAKSFNAPTINLGLQYMFHRKLGAKLDFGYNRFSHLDDTPEFKVNYTRLNLQLVYNANSIFNLNNRMGVFMHIGPGISMINPLGNFAQNTTSYLNLDTGFEFHYGISDNLSVFLDTSYIHGFAKDFSPIENGIGSFNGNIVAITIGASISLSGCYFCDQ